MSRPTPDGRRAASRPGDGRPGRVGMIRAATTGALAGLVATGAMSPVMAPRLSRGLSRQGGLHRFPPRRIVRRLESAFAGRPVAATATERVLTLIAHAGYGCALGAVLGVLRNRHRRRGPLATGFTFGLGVWAAGYAGWVPVLGIREGTVAGRRSAIPFPLAAHIVYGLVLGLAEARLARPRLRA
jgi:hypothetical protein